MSRSGRNRWRDWVDPHKWLCTRPIDWPQASLGHGVAAAATLGSRAEHLPYPKDITEDTLTVWRMRRFSVGLHVRRRSHRLTSDHLTRAILLSPTPPSMPSGPAHTAHTYVSPTHQLRTWPDTIYSPDMHMPFVKIKADGHNWQTMMTMRERERESYGHPCSKVWAWRSPFEWRTRLGRC